MRKHPVNTLNPNIVPTMIWALIGLAVAARNGVRVGFLIFSNITE